MATVKSTNTMKAKTTSEPHHMEETTIKSNSNSVSNGCDFRSTFKRHLTTCLQRWRQKHSSNNKSSKKSPITSNEHQQQEQQLSEEECHHQCPCQQNSDKWFKRYTRKEFLRFHTHYSASPTSGVGSSFMQRTTVYCKTLNTKLYKILIPKELRQRRRTTISTKATTPVSTIADERREEEGPHPQDDRKVEIVAKLLSSTLVRTSNISTSTSSHLGSYFTEQENYCSQRRRNSVDSAYHSVEESFEIFQSSITSSTTTLARDDNDEQHQQVVEEENANDMVVSELTFLEIRDEYPDLDSEIRSILTARAQDGATISDIRDDYRKLTGLTFPIYESVTEFLLTIPYVSAYCNENGTRIFNIRPMEKTKHIHNMVMEQKPHQETTNKPSSFNHRRYREHQRNTNYYPNNYRRNYQNQQPQQPHQHHFYEPIQIKSDGPQQQQQHVVPSSNQILSQNAVVTENLMLKSANTDKLVVQDNSEGFVEDNWIYNDNCNYLLNRIHSQDPVATNIYANQMMIPSSDMYIAADDQQHQNLQQFFNGIPTGGQSNFNMQTNIAMPSCENNMNYLNNLFQNQELPINTHNNMILGGENPGGGGDGGVGATATNPRRSSYGTQKSLMPRSSRSSSPTTKSCYTNDSLYADSDYEAHLLDFLLLGDDFFLYMARMELRCKFKKRQKVLQSGLCVSGQTIGAAIKRVIGLQDNGRSIILNIGSVNIMQGRQLIQIEHEYRELLTIMLKKGIQPILTTLAPLANYTHDMEMKRTLERFNKFIKSEAERNNLIVIDIWKCLVNDKGVVRFDCYQNEPRNVTGASEPYVFWNNIGRQRVLRLIESQLEY
uniref:HTH OST-type domain-containing protein n=1 Tax=Musca domestica TaxID=7370 RepID=A0A1I8MS01_MUSDO